MFDFLRNNSTSPSQAPDTPEEGDALLQRTEPDLAPDAAAAPAEQELMASPSVAPGLFVQPGEAVSLHLEEVDAPMEPAAPLPGAEAPIEEASEPSEPEACAWPPTGPTQPAGPTLAEMLAAATERHASDLMFTPGEPPLLRIDGQWSRLSDQDLDEELVLTLLREIAERAELPEEALEQGFDAAIEAESNMRFRVNAFRHRGRAAAVLRVIPQTLLSLEDLGLPANARNLAAGRQGLVLVTGATGHGKTTTLAALIDIINTSYNRHIITLEDPIEFVHSNKRSVIHQREIGRDAPNFADGLRAALRQSPDTILVGELRDLETIGAALTAAETGHLVLGTLHTSSAIDTIDRIVDVFPAIQQPQVRTQLASSLSAVISQVLIPEVGGGRVLAYEMMMVTSAIRNLIRENKTHQIITAMQTGRDSGMITLERVLASLHEANRITYEQALQVARNRETFENLLKKSL